MSKTRQIVFETSNGIYVKPLHLHPNGYYVAFIAGEVFDPNATDEEYVRIHGAVSYINGEYIDYQELRFDLNRGQIALIKTAPDGEIQEDE